MFGTLDNHPAEYAVKTLRDLSECYAGATPSTKVKEYWDNGSIPWMSSGEVHMEHVTETESKITESGYQQTSTKMVPVHSVVIALAGQGKTRGKVAITEIPLCTNQSLCAIVPSKDIHYEYLYHNLKGRYLELRGMAGDVNGRGGLNLKIVQSIQVIVPPIDEQMKFVAIAQQADKSKFSGLKSQFIEMFGSRDFLKRLGDYVSVKTGKLDANASVEGGRYPFFTCAEKTLSIDTYAFDCNAVLLAGNGEFCVKHYDGKFNAYQRTYVIESKDESILSTKYLYAWLKDYANILKANAIGGVIKYIKLGDIINAQINLPSQDRQLEYVKIYEQADKSKQIAFSRAS